MHDYVPVQDWVAFATVAGAAAASLAGLLFVAVSIRIDVIGPSPELRNRSAQTFGRVLDAIAPNAVTSVLVLVSGALVAAGVHAGLYVLVVPVIAALVGGVASAWLLLTRISA